MLVKVELWEWLTSAAMRDSSSTGGSLEESKGVRSKDDVVGSCSCAEVVDELPCGKDCRTRSPCVAVEREESSETVCSGLLPSSFLRLENMVPIRGP